MPSNQTTNYQLSQWEPGDKVQRTDFNADNAKIDAALAAQAGTLAAHAEAMSKLGNCRIWTTTYTGTGKGGKDHPNTLTFPARPIFFYIKHVSGVYHAAEFYGCKYVALQAGGSYSFNPAIWVGNTVSWYCESGNDTNQMNDNNIVYNVFTLLAADADEEA